MTCMATIAAITCRTMRRWWWSAMWTPKGRCGESNRISAASRPEPYPAGYGSGRDAAEMRFDSPQRPFGVHIADHHQRRIVRHVMAAIVAIQVIARHGLQ